MRQCRYVCRHLRVGFGTNAFTAGTGSGAATAKRYEDIANTARAAIEALQAGLAQFDQETAESPALAESERGVSCAEHTQSHRKRDPPAAEGAGCFDAAIARCTRRAAAIIRSR
jgi:hypothetical protein